MKKFRKAWKNLKYNKLVIIIKNYIGLDDIIAIVIGILGVMFYCKNNFLLNYEGLYNFYKEIHINLIILAITVLIIDNANQYTHYKFEKRSLIIQLSSSDNRIVKEATSQLRERGWLYDGSLNGAYLVEANLSGADLRRADLKGAKLRRAELGSANLKGATYNEKTDWRGVTYNMGENGTVWPDERFDPDKQGAILDHNS